MRAHDQEERPGHQQQQEAELEHDQGQRDQQDEQPGHQGREHRGERDLQPGGPLVALEQRVDGRVLLLHGAGDAAVGGLLGLDQRGARRLVGRDRLRPQQLTAVLVDHGLLAAGGGRVLGAAQLPVQPRLAHQHRPQLVGVLVDQGVARGEREVAGHALRVALLHRQAVAAGRDGQLGERGVQHAGDAVGHRGPDPGERGGPADQRDRGHAGHHHPQRALDGPGGALADQALPGQPDRAEDDHRRQVGEVDRVAQRADQPVHRVLQPGQDVVARRRLVHGDRYPVNGLRRVEDHPGYVVADQRRHIRALQAVRGPELPGHPVVVVQRLAARPRARRLDHRVDAAGGLLGLGQRRLADVVHGADDPA